MQKKIGKYMVEMAEDDDAAIVKVKGEVVKTFDHFEEAVAWAVRNSKKDK